MLRGSEMLATVSDVYARFAHTRPGTISRPDSFHERYLEHAIKEDKPSFVVVHADDDGSIDGYAHYSVAWNDDPDGSGGKGEIHEVIGADTGVELALWQYLMDVDLIRTWKADERPSTTSSREAFADRRAYEVKSIDDEQWLRLIDVDAALRARTYNAALGIGHDRRHRPVAGRQQRHLVDLGRRRRTLRRRSTPTSLLTSPPSRRRTWAEPAGRRWWRRVAVERTPGAAAIADVLFASRPLPFCGSFF